jgi:hypothetical protein
MTLPPIPLTCKRVRPVLKGIGYTYTIYKSDQRPLAMFLLSKENIETLIPTHTDDEVKIKHFKQVMCCDLFAEWQDWALSQEDTSKQEEGFNNSHQWMELATKIQ